MTKCSLVWMSWWANRPSTAKKGLLYQQASWSGNTEQLLYIVGKINLTARVFFSPALCDLAYGECPLCYLQIDDITTEAKSQISTCFNNNQFSASLGFSDGSISILWKDQRNVSDPVLVIFLYPHSPCSCKHTFPKTRESFDLCPTYYSQLIKASAFCIKDLTSCFIIFPVRRMFQHNLISEDIFAISQQTVSSVS